MNDTAAVAALEAAAYEDAAHTPWTEKMFYEELSQPGRSWWVVHDQGTVIGFAGGVLAGADFEIEEVVVDAARRREGIATRLVARVAYDAQMLGAQTVSLEVDDQNEPARALYGALGLTEDGRRPGYYPAAAGEPAHDALILRRPRCRRGGRRDRDRGARSPAPLIRPWPIVPGERTPEAAAALAAAGPLILTIESPATRPPWP